MPTESPSSPASTSKRLSKSWQRPGQNGKPLDDKQSEEQRSSNDTLPEGLESAEARLIKYAGDVTWLAHTALIVAGRTPGDAIMSITAQAVGANLTDDEFIKVMEEMAEHGARMERLAENVNG